MTRVRLSHCYVCCANNTSCTCFCIPKRCVLACVHKLVCVTAKKQCALWPSCDEDTNDCGGCTKEDCNVFERMGTKRDEAPSDQEI